MVPSQKISEVTNRMISTTYFEKREVCTNGKCKVESKICDNNKCTKKTSKKRISKMTPQHYIKPIKKQKMVNIVSFRGCTYCNKAKELLKKHKIPFRELKTVPQIYMMGERIGGYNNLVKFLDGK